MSKFTITSKVKRNNFGRIQGATVSDLANALYLEAELIMTDSKTNYVPVVSGDLRGSGTVKAPQISGNSIEVVLGYGGVAAPYAVKVHEAPRHHGQHKNKYLSKPLKAAERGMVERLANHVRSALRRR